MFCNIMLEARQDRFVEELSLAIGLGNRVLVKCLKPKQTVTAAMNVDTNCSLILVSK